MLHQQKKTSVAIFGRKKTKTLHLHPLSSEPKTKLAYSL